MLGAERVGGQLLRLDQGALGLQQVVEPADLGQVDRQHVVADEVAEGAIHPDPLLVAGRVERDDARIDVVQQHLKVRGARVVERGAFGRRGRARGDHNGGDYITGARRLGRSALRTHAR